MVGDFQEVLTVPALAGVIAPLLVALMARTGLRSSYKRIIAIGVTIVLTCLGMVAFYMPDTWQQVATVLAAGMGVTQTVYTALKPLWDYVEGVDAGDGEN